MGKEKIQYIDGVSFRLSENFDFSFLNGLGKVFKVFDEQDSGNICFGILGEQGRVFVKFAGAPTLRSCVSREEAVKNLKATVPIYKALAHPSLISLVNFFEAQGGFAMVFSWVESLCMGIMYEQSHKKYMALPLKARLKAIEEIMDFHCHVAKCGFVSVDFYDGSVLYDTENEKTIICDIDFYQKQPFVNSMGKLWGSSRFMAPEEYILGAKIDELTMVYTMGATIFAMVAGGKRSFEEFTLSEKLFHLATRAVNEKREERYQSICDMLLDWRKYIMEWSN